MTDTPDPTIRRLTTEIARLMIEQAAPDEAALFDLAAEAYWEDPDRQRPSAGTQRKLGFGLGEGDPLVIGAALMVGRFVAQIVLGSMRKGLTDAGAEEIKRRVLDWLHRRGKDLAGEDMPCPAPLSAGQLEDARGVIAEVGGELGLSADARRRLEDALIERYSSVKTGGA